MHAEPGRQKSVKPLASRIRVDLHAQRADIIKRLTIEVGGIVRR
jgi:hypothetical protein